MSHEFPSHTRPNESVLEKYRTEITGMRQSQWPYRKISQWLLEEKDLSISHEAVRKFCKVRSIRKEGKPVSNINSKSQLPSANQPKQIDVPQVFRYDDSKPIQIKR